MFQHKKNGSWIRPKYVPADALVKYWCSDDGACSELLKSELFQACKDGHVEYRMKEHKLNYPIEVLFAENNLFIHLESFEKWIAGDVDDDKEKLEEELEYYQTEEVKIFDFTEENAAFQAALDRAADEAKAKKMAKISAIAEAEKLEDEEFENSKKPATPQTYESIIAVLDECLVGKYKGNYFQTDTKLRDFLVDMYGDVVGISKSSLDHWIARSRERLRRKHEPNSNEAKILKKYHIKIAKKQD